MIGTTFIFILMLFLLLLASVIAHIHTPLYAWYQGLQNHNNYNNKRIWHIRSHFQVFPNVIDFGFLVTAVVADVPSGIILRE